MKPNQQRSVKRVAKAAISADTRAREKHARTTDTATADSFVNFSQQLGVNANNAMTTSSYGFNPITRNRTLLEWMHRGSWLAGIVVDAVADDMTRAGASIEGDISPENIKRIESEISLTGVWDSVNECIKWARLYGGCIGVLLIDGQDPSTPLRLNTIRKGQFRGVMALDRWMIEPSLNELVTDFGPDIGKPKYYTVNADAPGLVGRRIHYSRCIRLLGVQLPFWQALMENLWGISVLERMYDRMVAFDSATTGAAQLVYKAYIRTYKIEGMREIIAAGGDALKGLLAYVDMMRNFQGIEGITLMDLKDEFHGEVHGAFSGLSDVLQQFGQQLSGASQIPLIRLFGQSPLGFNTGDSDMRNYYDGISQKQEKELLSGMTKVYMAAAASCGIAWGESVLKFNSLWQLKADEKADVANKTVEAISRAEEGGLIDKKTAMRELRESSQITGIFTNITKEQIEEADLEPPPIPGGPAPDLTPGAESSATDERGGPGLSAGGSMQEIINRNTARSTDAAMAAGVMLVNGRKEVLFLKRGSGGDHPGTWGLPGGHVERGESDLQAAEREMFEETGIKNPASKANLGTYGGFTIFACKHDGQDPVLNNESTGYKWMTLAEAENDPDIHPNMKEAIKKMMEGGE